MEKRLQDRITEICDAGGFSAGYRYSGPALLRDTSAAKVHETEASAYATTVAASAAVSPKDRAEALMVGKAAYKAGYVRGRMARVSIPPLGSDTSESYSAQLYPTGTLPQKQAPLDSVADTALQDGILAAGAGLSNGRAAAPSGEYPQVGDSTSPDQSADRPVRARSPDRS